MLTSSANENLIHRSCTFYGTLYALKEICKVGYAGGGGGGRPPHGRGRRMSARIKTQHPYLVLKIYLYFYGA